MKHLTPLTSLRFFAAFVVVLCHVRYTHEQQYPHWFWNFSKNGFVGVNLFFILSGFVIAYNYGEKFLERTTTFGKFMLARFARIWPAFVTALILAFPIYVLKDPATIHKLPLLIPVHLLLIHNWFPNLGAAWLSPSWTIGTEWGFYLMFPLFAAAIFRLREKGLWTLLIIAALLTFVAPVIYHSGILANASAKAIGDDASDVDFWGRVLRWYSIFRLPEFLVGVAVCRIFMLQTPSQKEAFTRWMGPVALISLGFIGYVMIADNLPMMFINQAVLTLPFAAVIWYLAYDRGLVAKWMAIRPLVFLGEASYSLYLIHLVVKQACYKVGRVFFDIPESSIPLTVCIIVFAIWASIFIYRRIEKPSRRWIVSRFGDGPKGRGTATPEAQEPEPAVGPALR
jgi:peptidoglycan/LPS O-acetylase OafA/YrhL